MKIISVDLPSAFLFAFLGLVERLNENPPSPLKHLSRHGRLLVYPLASGNLMLLGYSNLMCHSLCHYLYRGIPRPI